MLKVHRYEHLTSRSKTPDPLGSMMQYLYCTSVVCVCVHVCVRVLRGASSPSCLRLVCMYSRRQEAQKSPRYLASPIFDIDY